MTATMLQIEAALLANDLAAFEALHLAALGELDAPAAPAAPAQDNEAAWDAVQALLDADASEFASAGEFALEAFEAALARLM